MVSGFSLGTDGKTGFAIKKKNSNGAQDAVAFMRETTTVLPTVNINPVNRHLNSQLALKKSDQVLRIGLA